MPHDALWKDSWVCDRRRGISGYGHNFQIAPYFLHRDICPVRRTSGAFYVSSRTVGDNGVAQPRYLWLNKQTLLMHITKGSGLADHFAGLSENATFYLSLDSMEDVMLKFLFQIVVFGIAGVTGLSPFVYAKAPMVKTQVPGFYRINLGRFEVTALYDGPIMLNKKLLRHISAADLDRMLARSFVGNPEVRTSVNAYLINTGRHLVLIDTGAAKLFGPTLGHVPENMKAAGYDPSQVDTILITHMHGDHIGGLNDADGKPVYPNATIFVSKAESDFWLSQKIADKAAPKDKPFFKIARDVAAPYIANGKWHTFAKDGVLVPGIRAVNAKGHTPGHTAYAVESEGQKLLIWGDIVHFSSVQFARPGVSVDFDIDQKQAIATRQYLMKEAAADKFLIAGMHLPFPGIGHIRVDGKSKYSWIPINFGPVSAMARSKSH
jgi:glyoxylase-like metal-dependent hydrolase (beta-lactamase superfamily II)